MAEVARSILEEFGYAITVVTGPPRGDGAAGFEHVAIDMLFTDLVMPGGVNGVVLAREARKRRPKIKVLLTTGFSDTSLERADVGGDEFDLISKPYRRSELARKIRRVLDGPTGVG